MTASRTCRSPGCARIVTCGCAHGMCEEHKPRLLALDAKRGADKPPLSAETRRARAEA